MDFKDLTSTIPAQTGLSESQLKNIEGIIKISRGFHKQAGISEAKTREIDGKTLVLESGHQPNFMPATSVFKKIFLLDHISKKLLQDGHNPITLFGFADYNQSTAQLLHQSKIPAATREGYKKIGFTLEGDDRWLRFSEIQKPGKEKLEKLVQELENHYLLTEKTSGVKDSLVSENLGQLIKVLEESYEKATSFSQFNEYMISNTAKNLLELDVMFFRYTDVQKQKIFLTESQELSQKTGEYNTACNESVEKRGLKDEFGVAEDYFFPFWYHCNCGAKVTLSYAQDLIQGRCQVCDKFHKLEVGGDSEGLDGHYTDMAPTAIARNIVFAKGLGTTLFISGAGGGIRYGQIAYDVATKLGFQNPITLAWQSQDFQLGVAHLSALTDLAKAVGVSKTNLDIAKLDEMVETAKTSFEKSLEGAGDDKKSRQKYSGMIKNLETKLEITRKMFDVVPSSIDVFVNTGFKHAKKIWENTISDSEVQEGEFKIIDKDVYYENTDSQDKIKLVYDTFTN